MLKHTDRRILTLKAKFSREGRLRRVGGRSDRKWWDLGGSHHRQTSHQFWSEIHNRIHWIYTGYNRMHCPCCISRLHLSKYMHYGVPSFKKLGFYLEACISLQKYLFCSSIILDELPAWSFGQTRQAGFPHWLRGRRRASHFPMPGRLFIGHSYARHVSLAIICFPALFYLVNHYTLGFQICSVLPCTRTGVYTFMRYEAWANQKGDSVTRWRAILQVLKYACTLHAGFLVEAGRRPWQCSVSGKCVHCTAAAAAGEREADKKPV